MAIDWGSWEYSGGNGMRVGIDISRESVSHGDSSCKVTMKVYTQNQYTYSNPDMHLDLDGNINYTNRTFNNYSSGGTVKRAERTYTYNFDSNDYGSGNAKTVWIEAKISNAYNGVTPSQAVHIYIPKRPYENPYAPDDLTATRESDSLVSLTWGDDETAGRPWSDVHLYRWDNVSNSWSKSWEIGENAFAFDDTSVSANRRYRYRIRSHGDGGYSGYEYASYFQTTPASPVDCTVSKTSIDSVLVNWSNGASTSNGYTYDTLLEEQVDGGAWTEIATLPEGTASFSRTGRAPGSVYAYRVRARSTVGDTTHSAYSTSETIQLQSPPAAPTVVSTVRTNDNSFTLNWTNNPSGEVAPYDSLTVQRWDNVAGAWGTIGTLGATATSLTDTSTIVNRAYQWRITANNAAGSSDWAYFDTYQTRPASPSEVKTKAAPGGALKVTWINNVSYGSYSTGLRYYKNGVLVDDTISLAAGETTYTLNGVDLTATYTFGVKTVSTVGYASESQWIDGTPTAASTVPNAPADLAPNGTVIDTDLDQTLTWTHNPSLDESDQTAFEVEYSIDGGTTWASTGQIASTESEWTMPAGTVANGLSVTWQVRTWGVHATASVFAAPAVFQTSTTPTVTINEPAGATLPVSQLDVEWSYDDAEALPQASWEVELYNGSGSLLERKSGTGEIFAVAMDTVVVDGQPYVLRIRVGDGDGLKSEWVEKSILADFVPPAMPTLSADYSQDSGVTVLTLTPTADDGGVTTLPVIGVDVQRRLLDQATEVFGPWETLAAGVADDATLIDTTGPIANDGEYRVIAHSEAPSAKVSDPLPPSGYDDRWVYVSGGPNFRQVARLMGNIALRSTTSRERSLYQFAGRSKPVMFAGEARTRVIDVAGLLDGESSSPAEWEDLISDNEVLLFRDPLGHRIYGSVPQVAIDHIGNDMYAISFTVTEVSFP
jgi:hypothetical protein